MAVIAVLRLTVGLVLGADYGHHGLPIAVIAGHRVVARFGPVAACEANVRA